MREARFTTSPGTADLRISAAIQAFGRRGTRFRTVKRLRGGDPSPAIRRKHPAARFRRGSWTLVLARFPFGATDEPGPVLSARVGGGRVRALEDYIGGAGE